MQSIKTGIKKSVVSAIVFNYFNDIIDCLPGSKSNDVLFYSKLSCISNMQMFFVLNDDFLTFLFPFSCGVHYLLCFAYLQSDLNDSFQYAFWRSNLRVLLKKCTLNSILTTWTIHCRVQLEQFPVQASWISCLWLFFILSIGRKCFLRILSAICEINFATHNRPEPRF